MGPTKNKERAPWSRTHRLVVVGFIVTAILVPILNTGIRRWVFGLDKPAAAVTFSEFKSSTQSVPLKTGTKAPPPVVKPTVVIPRGTTINATTNAPNSAAVGINQGNITVNPAVDMTAPVISYFYNGETRVSRPGYMGDEVGESESFKTMVKLNSEQNWTGLLEICDAEIKKAPKWMTPYFFAGLSNANLQHFNIALPLLKQAEDGAIGNPDYEDLAKKARETRIEVEQYKREHPLSD